MAKPSRVPIPPGHRLVFRRWFRHPVTKKILRAEWFGLKAFPIIIKD